MVDEMTGPRFQAAHPPDGYASFRTWLLDALEPHGVGGLKAKLGHFINERLEKNSGPQMVNNYLKRGDIPERPVVRVIAEWAQVDYGPLQALVDKQEEERQLHPKSPPRPRKARDGRKRMSSPKLARLES